MANISELFPPPSEVDAKNRGVMEHLSFWTGEEGDLSSIANAMASAPNTYARIAVYNSPVWPIDSTTVNANQVAAGNAEFFADFPHTLFLIFER